MVTLEVHRGPLLVRLAGSDGEPLLEQLEASALPVRSLCCVGACETCAVAVRSGSDVLDRDAYGIGYSQDPGPGRALVCVAGLRASAVAGPEEHVVVLELP